MTVTKYAIILWSIAGLYTYQYLSRSPDQHGSIAAIYGRWYSAPLLAVLTRYRWPSVLAGSFTNSRLSAWFIPGFIRTHAINENDFLQPASSFRTFNQFFTRKLKPEARPIAPGEEVLISPADGAVLVIPVLHEQLSFPIKGAPLSLKTLVANHALTEEFKDGVAFIIRLAPWDYHRFHAPLPGVPAQHTVIPGQYHSVHPHVYRCGFQPLELNERHVITYETDTIGTLAIIPVGALFVGAITHTYTPSQRYQKGDELGYFSFGGSTIVLLCKQGTVTIPDSLLKNSVQGIETPFRMGEPLALSVERR